MKRETPFFQFKRDNNKTAQPSVENNSVQPRTMNTLTENESSGGCRIWSQPRFSGKTASLEELQFASRCTN